MTNQNTNQVGQQRQKPQAISLMEQNKSVINEVLPSGFDVGRLVRILSSQIRQNPKLGMCDPYSFMQAVMTCAQLGLEPSKTMGRIHLIPYGKEVQCIVGYQGLVDLARRSGEIEEIYAEVVYSNDHFDFEMGLSKRLEHKPNFGKERGEFVAAYAVAKYKNGGNHMVVMGEEEIEKIRKGGRYENKVWNEHYDEMAKKTAIRRLSKMLPMSVEIEKAATLLDQEHTGAPTAYKEELQEIGVEVLDVETTEIGQNELAAIVEKIAKKLETVTDKAVESRLKKTKTEILELCVNVEKAKTFLNLVTTI